MKIRPADNEDSREIWQWRNDATTKAMSLNSDEVSWESHQNWFAASLQNPRRFLFVGVSNEGRKVGMCRLDLDASGKQAEVSINLNPEMRGQGLSSPLLSTAIHFFWEARSVPVRATVKKINLASNKSFLKCRFVLDSEDAENNYYVLKP